VLDDQIGFLLRRAHQRHTVLFSERMPKDLTPTQFSALARLLERGALSQNLLGREIAVDAATIKGVVDRLSARGLVGVAPDETDGRRVAVSLTEQGRRLAQESVAVAAEVSKATLEPIAKDARATLLSLLRQLADGDAAKGHG
jgi:DNA-binding MarR family transcriptional regulator